jgi:serine/threonine protein kinase
MSGTTERTRYCSRCLTTFPLDAPRCPNLGCRSVRPNAGWGELLEAGEVLDRTYRIHCRLAIGGAGATYLAGELGPDGQTEVGPRVAVKVLYQQRDQGSYLRRLSTEAQILQGMNHPHIVECRGFVHRAGHSPYLVTRYEEGGSLLDHIRRVGTLPIPIAASVGRQICQALEVAHRQGVVHRDLKPENVLLVRPVAVDEEPELRVADFGIAKVYGGVGDRLTRVGAFVGTPQYAAPEQFDGLAPEPATDVYAVGAVVYFCLAARPVADLMAELDPDSQKEHLIRHLPPKLEASVGSPDLRKWMEDTLASAMAVDPGDRCEITQLEGRLASIEKQRDPGFLRKPPAGDALMPRGTISQPDPTAMTLGSGFVRPILTEDVAEPAQAPRLRTVTPGERTVERQRPAKRSSSAPLGCGLVAMGGGGLALVAAVVVAWLVFVPGARPLSSKEADPEAKKDWELIAGTLGVVGVAAERACDAPKYFDMSIVVEPDGTLRSLELHDYPHEPTRACLEAELRKTTFPRALKEAVAVRIKLPD